MKIKQSEILESLIIKGVELHRRSRGGGVVDAIFLATILSEQCHATRLLRSELKEWELYQLRVRLENGLMRYPRTATLPETDVTTTLENLYEGMAHLCRTTLTDGKEERLNTGHLLLYVMRETGLLSSRILSDYAFVVERVEAEVRALPADEDFYSDMEPHRSEMRPIHITTATESESKERERNEVLERFGTDLTAAARRGELDPVVGREREVERVVQILGRRRKNNPILIGEAGVGKSAIVEGLALLLTSDCAPAALSGKRVFSLDVARLVAGTKYRGEFEERVSKLVEYLAENQDIILFVDEIHNIVGAGSSQGSLDAANILKPALARGAVQCIGATTLAEYREHFERDAALDRRFQRVMVEQTTPEQTLQILHNLRPRYEEHHSVRYTDEALACCVSLAERYITDRHFPDKAIDLLDEVGARAALSADEGRVVGEEEVRSVVALATGIPAESLSQGERQRLSGLAERLGGRVVGQQRAVERLARSVVRSRAGLSERGRPMGVFLFVGPTGVGKTLLAKELAEALFDRPDALLRLDMSEYAERHNMSRMIGSPPGYVGYGEGGRLTEAVRRQPYSVILLDEIEKAHPEVYNLLLQLFDEGHLTDGVGRRVDFRNTVIIMTSNLGSGERQVSRGLGYYQPTQSTRNRSEEQRYLGAVEEHFSPEFVNRLDEIVCFDALDEEAVGRIVDLELESLFERLAELDVRVEITHAARGWLAAEGYDSRYGARALKRLIMEKVENPVAQMIVSGALAPQGRIVIDANDTIFITISTSATSIIPTITTTSTIPTTPTTYPA